MCRSKSRVFVPLSRWKSISLHYGPTQLVKNIVIGRALSATLPGSFDREGEEWRVGFSHSFDSFGDLNRGWKRGAEEYHIFGVGGQQRVPGISRGQRWSTDLLGENVESRMIRFDVRREPRFEYVRAASPSTLPSPVLRLDAFLDVSLLFLFLKESSNRLFVEWTHTSLPSSFSKILPVNSNPLHQIVSPPISTQRLLA